MVLLVLVAGAPATAQDHGDGGGTGCGDVFGDLVHILRNPDTGQPILAQRWIELPTEIPGYGWGYCPIAVDAAGNELGFLPYSCDVADPLAVEEVDYFGRLNGGRTKERNNRMHLNEVISTIKEAGYVKQEQTGRLVLGFDCAPNAGDQTTCEEWATIDSPMESLGLYTRLMKYGHLQTDPLEVDPWFHGDPALGTQYHPALGPEDWPKFHSSVRHLLPGDGAATCFTALGFDPACAAPESLTDRDFVRAGSFLAGAANKTGIITADLVQYLNRILKIARDTEVTVSTPDTLPALVRDCWDSAADPPTPSEDDPAPVESALPRSGGLHDRRGGPDAAGLRAVPRRPGALRRLQCRGVLARRMARRDRRGDPAGDGGPLAAQRGGAARRVPGLQERTAALRARDPRVRRSGQRRAPRDRVRPQL